VNGARAGIEERTKVWGRTIVDRTAESREWVRIIRALEARCIRIYAMVNNNYQGHGPDTVNTILRIWSATEAAKTKERADNIPTNIRFDF
jgi:uncharacterized protein YecE (DUF72 family)